MVRTKTATATRSPESAKLIAVKSIRIAPIPRQAANALVKRLHYSGRVVGNSQLHFGVFVGDKLEGAMQFGPSMDKRKLQGVVRETPWNGFLELNRMAFSDRLPRNSESRALSIAFMLIRKHYPHIQWVVSFSDGTQSGDGTIYRASGFVLTGIRKNTTIWGNAQGEIVHDIAVKSQPHKKEIIFNRATLTDTRRPARQEAIATINRVTLTKGKHMETGGASMKMFKDAGFKPLPGFQLRYIYFLDPTARARLTLPEVPFSKIAEMGAKMYRGKQNPDGKSARDLEVSRVKQAMAGPPEQRRGSADPHAPKKKARG